MVRPKVTSPTSGKILNIDNGTSFVTTWEGVYGIGGVQSYEIKYGVDRNQNGTIDNNEYATRTVNGSTLQRNQQFSTDYQGLLSVQVRAIYNIPFSPNDPTSNRGPWSEEVFYSRDTVINLTVAQSTEESDTPTISGTADEDAQLAATIDGDDYTVVRDGTAWSVIVPVDSPLAVGPHLFKIVATDTAGNQRTKEAQVVVAQATNPTIPVVGGGDQGDSDTTDSDGTVTTTVTPTVTPTITGFAGVLGANSATDGTDATDDTTGTPAVEGTSTEKNLAEAATSNTDGKAFGLAWYWWLLILAALATIIWWIIAAIRNRQAQA